jgi:hypothetical protein
MSLRGNSLFGPLDKVWGEAVPIWKKVGIVPVWEDFLVCPAVDRFSTAAVYLPAPTSSACLAVRGVSRVGLRTLINFLRWGMGSKGMVRRTASGMGLFCWMWLATPFVWGASQVTLTVDPNPAKVKQKITLTATVSTNGNPASGGTVTFYNGKVPMADVQVVGTHPANGYVQGTAVLTTILAPGGHPLTAVYGGTAKSPGQVKSNTVQLSVTGQTGSVTVLAATANAQNPKNYDFTATVGGLGAVAPTGTVDFVDVTTGTDLGSAAIAAGTFFRGARQPQVTNAFGMPSQSVVADFNGDGIPDVATANASFGPSTMAVFLGKGNGTFQPPVSYPTNVFTSGIVTGDFNQDGIPDIAAMSQGSTGLDGDVAVFLGNGDGSFSGPVDNVLGTFPVSIAMGDFDRDGILDVATVDYFTGFISI